MLVLEIAHAHTTGNIAYDAIFEQLDVQDFVGFFDEIGNFAFGCGEIAVRAETPHVFGNDVVVSKAHIDCAIFFGNEFQEFHVGEVVVRDIACNAASVSRQKVSLEEWFKMFVQHGYSACHRCIEIDVQVADKIVGHAL